MGLVQVTVVSDFRVIVQFHTSRLFSHRRLFIGQRYFQFFQYLYVARSTVHAVTVKPMCACLITAKIGNERSLATRTKTASFPSGYSVSDYREH